ncbi:hypothetical protein ACFL5C_02160, partial [Candidatus Omnitrophota bacterium]
EERALEEAESAEAAAADARAPAAPISPFTPTEGTAPVASAGPVGATATEVAAPAVAPQLGPREGAAQKVNAKLAELADANRRLDKALEKIAQAKTLEGIQEAVEEANQALTALDQARAGLQGQALVDLVGQTFPVQFSGLFKQFRDQIDMVLAKVGENLASARRAVAEGLKAHPPHAPPVLDVTTEEFAQIQSYLSDKPENIRDLAGIPHLIDILAYFAARKDSPFDRRNARRALAALLDFDIEAPFTPEVRGGVIDAYTSEDKEKRQILDAIIESARLEDENARVRKNSEELSEAIKKTKEAHEAGKEFADKARGISPLIQKVKGLIDKLQKEVKDKGVIEDKAALSELYLTLKQLLEVTTGETFGELLEEDAAALRTFLDTKGANLEGALQKIIGDVAGLARGFGGHTPQILLDLQASLGGLSGELAAVFADKELPGTLLGFVNATKALAYADRDERKKRAPIESEVTRGPVEGEKGTIDMLDEQLRQERKVNALTMWWKKLRLRGATRGKLEEILTDAKASGWLTDDKIKSIREKIEEIYSGKPEFQKEDIIRNINGIVIPLILKGVEERRLSEEELARFMEKMKEFNQINEDYCHYLNAKEMKSWAAWVKGVVDVGDRNIESSAGEEITGYLEKLKETGEAGELINKIDEMSKMMQNDIEGLDGELKKAESARAKTKARLDSGTHEDGRPLDLKAVNTFKERLTNLDQAIKELTKQIENLKGSDKKKGLKQKLDDARGDIDEIVKIAAIDERKKKLKDTEEALREVLMVGFVKSRVSAQRDRLKKNVTEKLKGILVEDKKTGGYTEESMRKAYKSITGYEKFMAMSCVDLSMKYYKGYKNGLHEVQLLAGLLSADGFIINLKTGEGKTEFATVALTIASLTGLKASAETSNENLARKDHLVRKGIFDFMGIRSKLFSRSDIDTLGTEKEKREALEELFNEGTDVDIVTFDTAGFNFELATEIAKTKDGDRVIKSGRKFMFIITDEIDAAMREASTQYRIALQAEEIDPNGKEYGFIKTCVEQADKYVKQGRGRYIRARLETGDEKDQGKAEVDYYYTVDDATGNISYTESGKAEIESAARAIARERGVSYERAREWLEKSITMIETYDMDVEYSTVSGEVKLYDASGLLGNRRLSNGRHTVLEMYLREIKRMTDVVVYGDSESTSEVGGGPARTEYFSVNTGASGTALASEGELKDILGNELGVADIPRHSEELFETRERFICDGNGDRMDMLRAWVRAGMKTFKAGDETRFMLPASFMYVRDAEQAREIEKMIESVLFEMREIGGENIPEIKVQIIHGGLSFNELEEARKKSGERNHITIFTDAGARGVDYQAFFENIGVKSPAARVKQFRRLSRILGEEGLDMDDKEVKDKLDKLTEIMLDADENKNREDEGKRKVIEERFKKFFDEIEEALNKRFSEATTKEKGKWRAQLLKLHVFRTNVETRYVTGFRLLSQISDKSIGDLLQALGRVGRQSDPARIALFLDISTESDDVRIIREGFAEQPRVSRVNVIDDKMSDIERDMARYKYLTNRLRKGEKLTDKEIKERDNLRERIYRKTFDALWELDKKGQKQRIENHAKDLAVHDVFANVVAPHRGKLLAGKVKGQTAAETAVKWIDEIVKRFATADEAQAKKLRALFVMTFGDEAAFMDGLLIRTKDGGVISVRNLDKNNIKIFAEVLKALIQGTSYDELSYNLKEKITPETFEGLSAEYNSKSLLTQRFKGLYERAISELLQYEYFEEVGKKRDLTPKDFADHVKNWVKEQIRKMPTLMPARMVDACLNGINKELETLLSEDELRKAETEKTKMFGDRVRSALKRIQAKRESPAGRVTLGVAAGAGLGAVVGSVVPVIGTLFGAGIGAAVGGVAGFVSGILPEQFGWEEMKEKLGKTKAAGYLASTVARETIEGTAEGTVVGAAIGAVLGGIGGFVFGFGGGAIPGVIAGAKAGAIAGAIFGGVGKGSIGAYRVKYPRAVSLAERKTARRREEEAKRAETRREFEAPLARMGQPHVREKQKDEWGQQMDTMFGRDENGTPATAIREILAGEREEKEKAETKDELRARIRKREVEAKGRKVRVYEVSPRKGKDGKPIGEGTLTASEQMEALRMHLEEPVPSGGVPPDFICVPYMALATHTGQRSDEDDNDDRAMAEAVQNILQLHEKLLEKEKGKPLCIFATGRAGTKEDSGYGFTGVVPMTYDQARAMSKAAEDSGVALDLTLPEGETVGFRMHNGEIIVMVRCDDGRVITRNFGRQLSEGDVRTLRALVALAALKA